MSNETVSTVSGMNPVTSIFLLAMALGPLAALAFGSKYADEETLERARAGLVNAKPSDLYMNYDSTRAPGVQSNRTIAEIAEGSGIFSELRAAIKAAGADAMLSSEGPFTVFAPSDEAFAKMPAEQRTALLQDPEALNKFIASHIVPGRLTETELMQRSQLSTLSGDRLAVTVPGEVKVGDASVSQSIIAGNGMVHVIDKVLL